MVDLVGGDVISVLLCTGTFEILVDWVPWCWMSPVDQVFVCKEAHYHGYQHKLFPFPSFQHFNYLENFLIYYRAGISSTIIGSKYKIVFSNHKDTTGCWISSRDVIKQSLVGYWCCPSHLSFSIMLDGPPCPAWLIRSLILCSRSSIRELISSILVMIWSDMVWNLQTQKTGGWRWWKVPSSHWPVLHLLQHVLDVVGELPHVLGVLGLPAPLLGLLASLWSFSQHRLLLLLRHCSLLSEYLSANNTESTNYIVGSYQCTQYQGPPRFSSPNQN